MVHLINCHSKLCLFSLSQINGANWCAVKDFSDPVSWITNYKTSSPLITIKTTQKATHFAETVDLTPISLSFVFVMSCLMVLVSTRRTSHPKSFCVYGLVDRTITYWQLNNDVTLCVQSDRHWCTRIAGFCDGRITPKTWISCSYKVLHIRIKIFIFGEKFLWFSRNY